MKRLLIIGLALTVIGTTSIPAFATVNTLNGTSIQSISKSNTLTKDSYISWLNAEIKKSTGNEKNDLKTTLNQFKSLTKEKQEKFIGYLNNPQVIVNALNTAKQEENKLSLTSLDSSSQPASNKVIKYNDDITVKVSSNIEELSNTNEQNNRIGTLSADDEDLHHVKGTYKHAITCLGVDVFQAIIWVRYTHNGDEVVSVDDGNAFTGTNYDPLLDTSWSDVNLDYNSQKAWATSDVTFSFVYKTSMTKMGSAEVGVSGDVNKDIDGWTNPY